MGIDLGEACGPASLLAGERSGLGVVQTSHAAHGGLRSACLDECASQAASSFEIAKALHIFRRFRMKRWRRFDFDRQQISPFFTSAWTSWPWVSPGPCLIVGGEAAVPAKDRFLKDFSGSENWWSWPYRVSSVRCLSSRPLGLRLESRNDKWEALFWRGGAAERKQGLCALTSQRRRGQFHICVEAKGLLARRISGGRARNGLLEKCYGSPNGKP